MAVAAITQLMQLRSYGSHAANAIALAIALLQRVMNIMSRLKVK